MKHRLGFIPSLINICSIFSYILLIIQSILDYINRFPKQKEIRQQWLGFCGINEDVLNTATRICSNHFQDYLKNKRGKAVVLNSNAVPSICNVSVIGNNE